MQTTLSAPVRQSLLSMRGTADMLSKTQARLATGKRVNSALDNPTSFFQAKSLDSRAAQLTQLLDRMNMAQSTVEAADNAIKAIDDLVGQARGLAQQALSAPGAVTTVTGSTTFNAGGTSYTDVVVDGVTTRVEKTASDTAETYAAKITSEVEGASASVNGAGMIVIEGRAGSTLAVADTGPNDGFVDNEPGVTVPNATRAALAEQFNEVRAQIDEIARDAGFNGVNLLGGDSLDVILNEQSSSSGKQSRLTLDGQTVDSTSLGIERIGAFDASTNTAGGLQMDSAVFGAMDQLTEAVRELESISSSYASDAAVLQIREDFTNDMVATLRGGAADLTEADVNEESARMLALQTRQQLASTAMALSAQAEQSVLRLF